MSETFALCGWGITFEELKWIAQWQFVNGASFSSVPDWAEEGKAKSIWRDDGYCFVKFGFDN
ncbi:MAG TPA: hypothetical protein DHW61_02535 [Lachnoclostridium phytofermentans]|uniref:Uncharacterized protein n=1 Tax=Lachnoclostridium phytofermentans TaxID=66219 RepID=A0A3D2X3R7_9FIRM|nr:hypothetical protein [Lachnoclostridium sp.]HCL01283.1 hypothetical protein [Lachnoclostridium phytofermentans]